MYYKPLIVIAMVNVEFLPFPKFLVCSNTFLSIHIKCHFENVVNLKMVYIVIYVIFTAREYDHGEVAKEVAISK